MTVDVVIGIFLKGKKFLAEKRMSDNPVDGGFICIPGGHIDEGESLEDALKREMKEELGLEVKKAELIFKDIYTASNGEKQLCHYFLIKDWDGKPIAKEAEKVFWESDVRKLTVDIDRRAVAIAFKIYRSYFLL